MSDYYALSTIRLPKADTETLDYNVEFEVKVNRNDNKLIIKFERCDNVQELIIDCNYGIFAKDVVPMIVHDRNVLNYNEANSFNDIFCICFETNNFSSKKVLGFIIVLISEFLEL